MKRTLVVVAAAALFTTGRAAAAAFDLSDADQQAAMQLGTRSVTAAGVFDDEWRVGTDGGEEVSVLTPFHRLAVAARHAAFKGEPLKPAEVTRVLQQDAGRLVLLVQLRGRSEDFARHYAPRLTQGTREVKPAFVQNERTAMRRDDGTYLARCVYGFPVRDLDARGRVGLTVADAEGREVSRFAIDLSRMR